MTPDEIQALRKKHAPRTIGVADFRTIDYPEHYKTIIACNICTVGENGKVLSWPCDTIKVLDAWETERTRKNHWSLNTLCYTCQVPYPCSIISNDKCR